MGIIDQIEEFVSFAKKSIKDGQAASIDELYGRWRRKAFENADALAVAAAIRDMDNGDRGSTLEEFFSEFEPDLEEDS